MNVRLLRKADRRQRGLRSWGRGTGRLTFQAPSHSHFGWWFLSWEVEGGRRGLDATRHRALAKTTARDFIKGTNHSRSFTAL